MSDDTPYRDKALPVEDRVADLLSRMSLAEKVAQIGAAWSTDLVEGGMFSADRAEQHLRHGVGHVTRIGGATGLRPRERAALYNEIQRYLVEKTRLGIPTILHEESCAGFAARDATQFPQAIGLASTWDPVLIQLMCASIRDQMLASGARQALAPVLDIARDPRWGRTEETFGEDPYLTSRMGVAYVRGLQGDNLKNGVVATGKHFIGYGAPEGGMNHAPAHIGPRELREIYARPFTAAIQEARLASIMNAYNDVDGLPCAGSAEILDDLLRAELGFEGVVVADYFAVDLLRRHHGVAFTAADAGQMAIEAGIDIELPSTYCYGSDLAERFETGACSEEILDRAVCRVLKMKFDLGLFEEPYVDEEAAGTVYGRPAVVALAKEIAEKSIVLLKNEGLLPLDPAIASLAVIGPTSDEPRLMLGDYHYPAHQEILYRRDSGAADDITPTPGSSEFAPGPYFPPMRSVADAIRNIVSASTVLHAVRGCDVAYSQTDDIDAAVGAARSAEIVIACVGGKSGLTPDATSGEFRDASDLSLTGRQLELIDAVLATGTPTVVVLINGRPLALPGIADGASAIVEAWLPGQGGGEAIAAVLFGAVNPAGRLPISLPRTVGQVPAYYGHKTGGGQSRMFGDYIDGPTTPLYPFGHGLSYTEFAYSDLSIAPESTDVSQRVEISCTVTNTGSRRGDEVVQLYLRDIIAECTRPVKQLAGFERLGLLAGETKRVTFQLDLSQLAYYDRRMQLIVEPGEVGVMVGASSDDIRLDGTFEIVGGVRELRQADILPTVVEVE